MNSGEDRSEMMSNRILMKISKDESMSKSVVSYDDEYIEELCQLALRSGEKVF